MPNPLYTYIVNIWFLNTFLDDKYCYLSLTIQLNSSHFFTQLNDQMILLQAIHFFISDFLVYSLNVKQFYLAYK